MVEKNFDQETVSYMSWATEWNDDVRDGI